MGGFNLFKGNRPQGVLTPGRLENMLHVRDIIVPILSEDDINDRSKGDGALQRSSGAENHLVCHPMHCTQSTRARHHPTRTASGYTRLRCVKWGCWNKPLGVNRAIPVYLVNHDDPPRSQVPFGGISAFGPAGKREGL